MQKRNGFTIIELMVVVFIIGIIATVTTLAYLNVQKEARDSKRHASAINLAESLERYYSKNGEYPNVATVTNPNATLVKQTLSVATINSLLSPNAPVGSNVNAWKSGTTSATNQLTYTPNTDTSTGCATGTTTTDTCADFKLQYYKEKTGTIETIYSRNKAIAGAPVAPPAPTIAAPTAPTITAAISGSNAVGTRTDTSCRAGAQLYYAFRSRTNDGTWSSYTAWDANATTRSVSAAQGSKYGFQVKAKCVEGDYSSADAVSSEATVIRDIFTPAMPGVYTTSSFRPNYNGGLCIDAAGAGNTNGTAVQVYTCNGTAAQDWAYNSNDRTIRPTYNMNLCVTNQGSGMQLILWTCDGNTARQWNYDTRGYLVSVSNGQCMDAANWGPSGTPINAWNCNNATAQIWNPSDPESAWDWADTACPTGTTVEYRVNHQMTNIADSGWISNGTTSRLVRGTTPQGYTYTTQVGVRCYSPYISSNWSANGSSSLVKAVLRPGAASGWAFWVWPDRYGLSWSWDSPACGSGTNRTYIEDNWVGTDNNANGSVYYWLSPRMPSGPGNIWWWTGNSTGGADYIWYSPGGDGRGYTEVYRPSGGMPYGVNVHAQTQYRCHNPTTGREGRSDWSLSPMRYT